MVTNDIVKVCQLTRDTYVEISDKRGFRSVKSLINQVFASIKQNDTLNSSMSSSHKTNVPLVQQLQAVVNVNNRQVLKDYTLKYLQSGDFIHMLTANFSSTLKLSQHAINLSDLDLLMTRNNLKLADLKVQLQDAQEHFDNAYVKYFYAFYEKAR